MILPSFGLATQVYDVFVRYAVKTDLVVGLIAGEKSIDEERRLLLAEEENLFVCFVPKDTCYL